MSDPRKFFVCSGCGFAVCDKERPWGDLSPCPHCFLKNEGKSLNEKIKPLDLDYRTMSQKDFQIMVDKINEIIQRMTAVPAEWVDIDNRPPPMSVPSGGAPLPKGLS